MKELITKAIETIKADKSGNRSAWGKGVTAYAIDLLEELNEQIEGGYVDLDDLETIGQAKVLFLNGADSWNSYSWGGCSLIYDYEIAERLCTPSELKRTNNGERKPNRSEEWLDTQARALNQACSRAYRAIKKNR